MLELLLLVVVVALIFDFINGFHDAANAIATSVATGVMSVNTAVVVSGVFNFLGALSGTAVAGFIASGLADATQITPAVVLAALIGASAWNLLTWWWGLPSSSSHALIGGLAGAVVAHAGFDAFHWNGLVQKVLIPLVASPLTGFAIAFLVVVATLWATLRLKARTVNAGARGLQFASACTLSFAHGLNDAQKVMGIIALALVAYLGSVGAKPTLVPDRERSTSSASFAAQVAQLSAKARTATAAAEILARADEAANRTAIRSASMPAWMARNAEAIFPDAAIVAERKDGAVSLKERNTIPLWAIIACATAMCLGTIAGGKRIIRTMGSKLIRLDPVQGFAAQTSGTAVIIAASSAGIPLSTTHCITSSIMGAGVTKGLAAIRWHTVASIIAAWIITLPASALVAAIAMKLCELAGW